MPAKLKALRSILSLAKGTRSQIVFRGLPSPVARLIGGWMQRGLLECNNDRARQAWHPSIDIELGTYTWGLERLGQLMTGHGTLTAFT